MGVLVKAASRLFFVKTFFVHSHKTQSHRQHRKGEEPWPNRLPKQGLIAVKVPDDFHRNQGKQGVVNGGRP
jgi:hypothetical protein